MNSGREFIGIERDESYYKIACSRLAPQAANDNEPLQLAA